ncbi:MAG: hypothetical protein KF732_10935 [Flavobacteriales bacterium]|nr:hypothetical protein [Flavobacteriales bacterium]
MKLKFIVTALFSFFVVTLFGQQQITNNSTASTQTINSEEIDTKIIINESNLSEQDKEVKKILGSNKLMRTEEYEKLLKENNDNIQPE